MRGLQFFIESYLLLSLAAGSLVSATTLQLGLTPKVNPLAVLVFFATFLFYNINRIKTSWNIQYETLSGKWMRNRLTVLNLFVLISILGIGISMYHLKNEAQLLFSLLACISLLYTFPVFKGISNKISLRTVPYLKIFLITGIWSTVTVLLPVAQSDFNPEKSKVILVFIERFVFVFVTALLFDVRDLRADKEAGLKTIPLLLGQRRTMQLANSLLFVFLIIITLHYKSPLHFVLVSFIVSALSTFVLINNKKLSTRPYFHRGIVDGMLLIQPFLVFIFYYLEQLI